MNNFIKKESFVPAQAGMSFNRYPLICVKCKKGKVAQDTGICTYVMCRADNKSLFQK